MSSKLSWISRKSRIYIWRHSTPCSTMLLLVFPFILVLRTCGSSLYESREKERDAGGQCYINIFNHPAPRPLLQRRLPLAEFYVVILLSTSTIRLVQCWFTVPFPLVKLTSSWTFQLDFHFITWILFLPIFILLIYYTCSISSSFLYRLVTHGYLYRKSVHQPD